MQLFQLFYTALPHSCHPAHVLFDACMQSPELLKAVPGIPRTRAMDFEVQAQGHIKETAPQHLPNLVFGNVEWKLNTCFSLVLQTQQFHN